MMLFRRTRHCSVMTIKGVELPTLRQPASLLMLPRQSLSFHYPFPPHVLVILIFCRANSLFAGGDEDEDWLGSSRPEKPKKVSLCISAYSPSSPLTARSFFRLMPLVLLPLLPQRSPRKLFLVPLATVKTMMSSHQPAASLASLLVVQLRCFLATTTPATYSVVHQLEQLAESRPRKLHRCSLATMMMMCWVVGSVLA